ncbi:MAG TPA: hypothetical protein VI566_05940 [Xanthomonadales bacterium]|nr:hypothetical protein [Xanthomonadales bacterium]
MTSTSEPQWTTLEGKFRLICRIFTTTSLALLLAACAATRPAEPAIQDRAQARWDALLAGDFDTAYGFLSPGYRSSHTRVDFEIDIRSHRVRWTSAEVVDSSCEADVCSVETRLGYKVAKPVPGIPVWESTEQVIERWVHTGGQWWYLPNK